jgi:hypothetical protein
MPDAVPVRIAGGGQVFGIANSQRWRLGATPAIHRQVSTLFPTWMEPFTQVRSTATAVFVTPPRATLLLLISAFVARPMKMALFGVAP